MLKETFIRGFSYSTPKPKSLSTTSISSSSEGDIIIVRLHDLLVEVFYIKFFSSSLVDKVVNFSFILDM